MSTLSHPPVEAYADAAATAQMVAFSRHWYASADEALDVLRHELTRLGLGDPHTACTWCAAPSNLCPDPEGHSRQAAETTGGVR